MSIEKWSPKNGEQVWVTNNNGRTWYARVSTGKSRNGKHLVYRTNLDGDCSDWDEVAPWNDGAAPITQKTKGDNHV